MRPGAPFIVSFSNSYFPMKAVTIWRSLDARGMPLLKRLYLKRAGFRNLTVGLLQDGSKSDHRAALKLLTSAGLSLFSERISLNIICD